MRDLRTVTEHYHNVTREPTHRQCEELAEQIRRLPEGGDCTHRKVRHYFKTKRVGERFRGKHPVEPHEEIVSSASTTTQEDEIATPPSQAWDGLASVASAPDTGAHISLAQALRMPPGQPYPVPLPIVLAGHPTVYGNVSYPVPLAYAFGAGAFHCLPFPWPPAFYDHPSNCVDVKAGILEMHDDRMQDIAPSDSPHTSVVSQGETVHLAPHGCLHELAAKLHGALTESSEDTEEAVAPKTFAELARWLGAHATPEFVDVNKLRVGGCWHITDVAV
ncbi:hypothetical protein C8Q76DRAFT_472000 [Earliella scabrosa]|nr:hypothetical protein C8Q76DRAFT_472000 [Earliella scabrosa]